MDFHPSQPTQGMPVRWASENDVWEIGLRPMMYGTRVSVGKVEPKRGYAEVYTLDYCAGSDQAFLLNLWATIVILMTALPESITPKKLRKLFPDYQVKPINKDPHCWEELQRLVRLEEPFPDYSHERLI
jgi:hypothetical protein